MINRERACVSDDAAHPHQLSVPSGARIGHPWAGGGGGIAVPPTAPPPTVPAPLCHRGSCHACLLRPMSPFAIHEHASGEGFAVCFVLGLSAAAVWLVCFSLVFFGGGLRFFCNCRLSQFRCFIRIFFSAISFYRFYSY